MARRPIQSGVLAGFVATVVLSLLMLMKGGMELVPELNVVSLLNRMMGTAEAPAAGWFVHFVIGTLLWGGLFGIVERELPTHSPLANGLLFSTGMWFMTMAIVMPIAGAGVFGLAIGMIAPMVTLMLHLVYGAVLGAFYGWLERGHRVAGADFWPGGSER